MISAPAVRPGGAFVTSRHVAVREDARPVLQESNRAGSGGSIVCTGHLRQSFRTRNFTHSIMRRARAAEPVIR